MSPPAAHHVVVCNPSWGHCRGQLTFGLRLLQLHSHVHYSIFVPSFIPQSIDPEISKADLDPPQRSRLNIIKYEIQDEMPGDPNEATADDLLWQRWSFWLAHQVLPAYKAFTRTTTKDQTGHARRVEKVFADGLLLWGFQSHLEELCRLEGVTAPKSYFLGPVSAAYCAT